MTTLPRLLGAAVLAAGATLAAHAAPATAAPCADVELVLARGTGEAPGVGGVGQSYVDALRTQLGTRTLDVYPVNYAASDDFMNREAFAASVADGVRDAGNHVQATAVSCPNTRIVLGGYSQGAALAAFVTSDSVPAGVPASIAPPPLPASVADHVAAVTLFGNPSPAFLQQYAAPVPTIGAAYTGKTLQLCAPGDIVCDGTPGGQPGFAHISYTFNGMTGEAAAYASDRIAPIAQPQG
jgi:cutinase